MKERFANFFGDAALYGALLLIFLGIAGLIWLVLVFFIDLIFGNTYLWVKILLAVVSLLISLFFGAYSGHPNPSIPAETARKHREWFRELRNMRPDDARAAATRELAAIADRILDSYGRWSGGIIRKYDDLTKEQKYHADGIPKSERETSIGWQVGGYHFEQIQGFIRDISAGKRSRIDFRGLLWAMHYDSCPDEALSMLEELWWLWMRVKRYFPG